MLLCHAFLPVRANSVNQKQVLRLLRSHQDDTVSIHPARNATFGSTRDARSAGIALAAIATSSNVAITTPNTVASLGDVS